MLLIERWLFTAIKYLDYRSQVQIEIKKKENNENFQIVGNGWNNFIIPTYLSNLNKYPII